MSNAKDLAKDFPYADLDGTNTFTGTNDFSGMPTVAGDPVVESGSNTDGYWTRWADGTQTVYKTDAGGDNNAVRTFIAQAFIVPSGYDNYLNIIPNDGTQLGASVIGAFFTKTGSTEAPIVRAAVVTAGDGTLGDEILLEWPTSVPNTDFRRLTAAAIGRWK